MMKEEMKKSAIECVKEVCVFFTILGILYISGLFVGFGIVHAIDGHIVTVNYFPADIEKGE